MDKVRIPPAQPVVIRGASTTSSPGAPPVQKMSAGRPSSCAATRAPLYTWLLQRSLYTWLLQRSLYTWLLQRSLYTWLLQRSLYTWLLQGSLYTWLLQRSLLERRTPYIWKTSTVIPVPKKRPPSWLNDCRPVSLTSVPFKCTERIVLKEL